MADELAIAMGNAGAELAETFSSRGYSGPRTRYGTVTANNGTTLDVALAGGTVPGVPMTTACVGARAGDRVLLTVDGPLVTATGILATADNGPYALHGTYQVGTIAAHDEAWAHVPVSFPDGDYGVSVHCCSVVPDWTRVSLMVDDFQPTRFSLRWCNDADVAVSGFMVTWLAVWAP